MRRLAGAAIVLGCGWVGAAAAQALAPPPSAALVEAAFTVGPSSRGDGPLDTLRIHRSAALPMNFGRTPFDAETVDVTLIRNWPSAVRFRNGDFELDLSPHAGVGVSSDGGQAEAGAMIRLSPARTREERAVEQLKDMGVRDGLAFADRGRWYLFAAASGRAVGLNMLRDAAGWNRAGWSTDPTSALIGDAQVGVGWRKGDVQSSFGVVHREVKGRHMVFGQHTRDDTLAAFTLSIRPQR